MRSTAYVTTTRGLRMDTLAWRLYEKGKKLAWDPADIDFSEDAVQWKSLGELQRRIVVRLAAVFMTGEEAVTLDIVPMMRTIAEQGRLEESMFLTTFVQDEAKHAEVFRRWFDAVGFEEDIDALLVPTYRHIFDTELPTVMGRLDTDRSPEALLDAALTYNQFVEGVLAMTGYWAWERIFTMQQILPGMRRALELIQRDERRHIAYGTYLCRRLVAADPSLWEFVEQRMAHLENVGVEFVNELAGTIITELASLPPEHLVPPGMSADDPALGDTLVQDAAAIMSEFTEYGRSRLHGRLKVIEVAKTGNVQDIERDTVAEDLELQMERG